MKKNIYSVMALFFLANSLVYAEYPGQISAYYSPKGGCEKAILEAIEEAEETIFIATYSFSSDPIAEALFAAGKRGVSVHVLMDKGQPTAHYSYCKRLKNGGLKVQIDRKHAIMHMKTIVIDSKTVICGSYNFTKSAEYRNAEILLVVESPELASSVLKNFTEHWQHSLPLLQKAAEPKKKALQPSCVDCEDENCPLLPSDPNTSFYKRRFRRWSN